MKNLQDYKKKFIADRRRLMLFFFGCLVAMIIGCIFCVIAGPESDHTTWYYAWSIIGGLFIFLGGIWMIAVVFSGPFDESTPTSKKEIRRLKKLRGTLTDQQKEEKELIEQQIAWLQSLPFFLWFRYTYYANS